VRVPLDAAAYAFRPGHRLRLAVSPTYWPWAWPSPEPVTLTVRTGVSVLELPVRPPRLSDGKGTDFADPPHTHGFNGDCRKSVEYEPVAQRRTITVDRIRKRRLARDDGLEVEGAQKDVFGISSDEPLSAIVECERRMAMHRGEWSVAVEASSTMSADAETFTLFHLIEAYENGECIYSRERSFEVPRSLV
jgi:hypothetical protein